MKNTMERYVSQLYHASIMQIMLTLGRIVCYVFCLIQIEVLTKGDNNRVDDRGLYAPGQQWLQREDILGIIRIFIPLAWRMIYFCSFIFKKKLFQLF